MKRSYIIHAEFFKLFGAAVLLLVLLAQIPPKSAAPQQVAVISGKGMAVVERPEIQVLYSPDLKLAEEGELVVCVYSPKAQAMVCMSLEEFDLRASAFAGR